MEEVFNEATRCRSGNRCTCRRRRKFYFDAKRNTLAAFVASVSDIDDIIPTLTAYQIEWNKINEKLNNGDVARACARLRRATATCPWRCWTATSAAPSISPPRISASWGRCGRSPALGQFAEGRGSAAGPASPVERRRDYRRAVQHWWGKIEAATANLNLAERPIYFISSNIHSMLNLISAWEMRRTSGHSSAPTIPRACAAAQEP
ncbi:MAG: hypothetical protein R3A10_11290 [Caldilineaceae bacterium]